MDSSLIEIKLKKLLPHLSKKEQIIANYIMEHPSDIVYKSINEVAADTGLAESTIFRFCKKIGYGGYQDLKLDLASYITTTKVPAYPHISTDDSTFVIAQKTFISNIKSIHDTMDYLNEEDLKKAVDILNQSNTVAFFGYGASGIVAMDAYQKFIRTSLKCLFTFDKHVQLMETTRLSKYDCAIIISHTGMTKDTLEICHAVKESNAKVIAITSYPLSLLAKEADVCLVSMSEEVTYRSEALSSRISQLSLIDALFVNYCNNHIDSFQSSLKKIRHVIAKTRLDT